VKWDSQSYSSEGAGPQPRSVPSVGGRRIADNTTESGLHLNTRRFVKIGERGPATQAESNPTLGVPSTKIHAMLREAQALNDLFLGLHPYATHFATVGIIIFIAITFLAISVHYL
jgi:hypothetical protein